jgi:Protein of unknown function (DUF1595)/ATP dependent DNA ligase domain
MQNCRAPARTPQRMGQGESPERGPGDTPSREKIFICQPAGASDEMPCAEKILNNIAHHAYRRPVTADDMPALLALYKQGAEAGGFEQGIRLALQKILVSPSSTTTKPLDNPSTRRRGSACSETVPVPVRPQCGQRSPTYKAPSGPGWVYEIKHDGYRLQVRREGDKVRLFTRRGYDWS